MQVSTGSGITNTNWRAVFPNEKCEFSAGWRVAQKTEAEKGRPAGCAKGWSGRLQKRTGRPAEKGSPPARPFLQPSLMFGPPTGSSCRAACRPTLLCSSPDPGKFIFSYGNTALCLVLSLVACISSSILTFLKCFVCLWFFIIFWCFFKVNSGFFS